MGLWHDERVGRRSQRKELTSGVESRKKLPRAKSLYTFFFGFSIHYYSALTGSSSHACVASLDPNLM
jgi:hypothetical protein